MSSLEPIYDSALEGSPIAVILDMYARCEFKRFDSRGRTAYVATEAMYVIHLGFENFTNMAIA